MRTNLSSQISLNRVSPKYYKPENAVERSVLTRCEKVPTDIYETMEEGVQHIANEITAKIQERQREGKFCVIGAGTGAYILVDGFPVLHSVRFMPNWSVNIKMKD